MASRVLTFSKEHSQVQPANFSLCCGPLLCFSCLFIMIVTCTIKSAPTSFGASRTAGPLLICFFFTLKKCSCCLLQLLLSLTVVFRRHHCLKFHVPTESQLRGTSIGQKLLFVSLLLLLISCKPFAVCFSAESCHR